MTAQLLAVLLAALFGSAQDSVAPLSPRLAALGREVVAGNRRAIDVFWDEVAARGTPLIEPFAAPLEAQVLPLARPQAPASTRRYALVTFLWRSTADARVIVLDPTLAWSVERLTFRRLGTTDVWYRSFVLPNDARFLYELSVNDPMFPFVHVDTVVYPTAAQADPLNPKRYEYLRPRVLSIAEMPDAMPLPWIATGAASPRGIVGALTDSLTSVILGHRRRVLVYRPANYSASAPPYPLLVFATSYINQVRLPLLLDHLISSGRIRPVVVAYIDHPPGAQPRETSCDAAFGRFLAEEFLPFVRARLNVTKDPRLTSIGGASASGLSAACAALEHPGAFGNVLAQSGAFWRAAPGEGEEAWFTRQVATRQREPVRFFLSIGLLENGGPFESGGVSMLQASRSLRDVLRARGYDVGYVEVAGAHDPLNWEATLADGLVYLLSR